jgi:CPA2 family monovalent cation:H+ antiporter-2
MESDPHSVQLTGLAIVALAALICGMAMQRFKQPAVAGYILAGVILGPSSVSLVQDRETIQALAELGVLMLLFLIGMELSLRGARAVWKIALATTAVQIAVGLLAMLGLGLLLDWSLPRIVLLGFVVALSSTAVAIKMLQEIGELRTRIGQVVVGVLIAQDLAVVPMMLVVGSFGKAGGIGFEAIIKVALSIAFLGFLIVYLSGRQRIRLPFARLVGSSVDLTPLAGLAFCFGAAAVSGLLGLSAAYGAFLAGLVIGNSTSRRVMIHYTAPIQSVLLMVFFLSIGLLIDLQYIWDNLATVLVVVAFITLFKTALNVAVLGMLGETWPRAFQSGVLLAQIGEFSFVLAALGLSVGSVSPENYRLIVAVTVLSLIVSPLWLEIARRLHRIGLTGVTSPRELLRLTFGRETAAVFRTTKLAEHRMIDMAGGATRWIGDIMPRRGRPPHDARH